MDEVLEKFEVAVITPTEKEDHKSTFEDLYKNWGRLGNQEERRKEILEVQKIQRNNKLDKFRGILDLVFAVEDNDIFRTHTKSYYRPTIYVAGFNKTSPTYSNVLMLSEWMVEKPEDFNENWSVVPCPKGVRMLVVASKGKTKFYTKFGNFKFACRTALPGGHPNSNKSIRNSCCVLDCFYQEKNNTVYILDILAWNNLPMTDGEAEFRNYWLKSQLADIPELKYVNAKNEVIFTMLPMTSCGTESFNNFMSSHPAFECNFPPLDGLLFYHKKAHYLSGETPLVGWLFPFMVPEVIGSDVTVNSLYLKEKPADYTNQSDFIQKFEAKYNKRKGSRRSNVSISIMDTVEGTSDNAQSVDDNNDISEVKEPEEKATNTMEAEDMCKMVGQGND